MEPIDIKNMSQSDIIQIMLNQANHNATREDVRAVDERLSHCVSKEDHYEGRREQKAEMAEQRTEFRTEMFELRTDGERKFEMLLQKMDEHRKDFQTEMKAMREDSDKRFEQVNQRFEQARIDGDKRFRWTVTTLIACSVALAVLIPAIVHYFELLK